jgi:L-fuconolactonase
MGALGAASFALQQSSALVPQQQPVPIIDAHIHLFDPTRPGGVPWPYKDDSVLYKPALPDRYKTVTKELGVVGAIAIEASPLASDNDWLLNTAAANPIIVGVIGDLIPGDPSYQHNLERLSANPLFLGFRYGNLWDRDLGKDLEKPGFEDGLKQLSDAGLVFESANPDFSLVQAIEKVVDHNPKLRVVIDHLPNAKLPTAPSDLNAYWATLKRLAQNKHVFMKLSEIPVVENEKLVTSAAFYKPRLDALWDIFGEDHIFFGSDWPNGDHVTSYSQTLKIVQDYIAPKGSAVAEKFFWQNSQTVYRWKKRTPAQPSI